MDSTASLIAFDVATAKNVALALVGVLGIGAVIAGLIIRRIVTKIITVAVLAVLALTVWSQRTNLQSCADRVRDADGTDVSCTFFGVEVDVPE